MSENTEGVEGYRLPEGLVARIEERFSPQSPLIRTLDRAYDLHIEKGEQAARRLLEPLLTEADVKLLMAVLSSLRREPEGFIEHLGREDIDQEVIDTVREARKYAVFQGVIRDLVVEVSNYENPITEVNSSPKYAIHSRHIESRLYINSFNKRLARVVEPVEEHINTAVLVLTAAVTTLEEAAESGLELDEDRRADAVRYLSRLSDLIDRSIDVLGVDDLIEE